MEFSSNNLNKQLCALCCAEKYEKIFYSGGEIRLFSEMEMKVSESKTNGNLAYRIHLAGYRNLLYVRDLITKYRMTLLCILGGLLLHLLRMLYDHFFAQWNL